MNVSDHSFAQILESRLEARQWERTQALDEHFGSDLRFHLLNAVYHAAMQGQDKTEEVLKLLEARVKRRERSKALFSEICRTVLGHISPPAYS